MSTGALFLVLVQFDCGFVGAMLGERVFFFSFGIVCLVGQDAEVQWWLCAD